MIPFERFLRDLAQQTAQDFLRQASSDLQKFLKAIDPKGQYPRQPLPPKPKIAPWRRELGFRKETIVTAEMIQQRFRKLALRHHPDKGGDPERFKKILSAREAALREVF